MLKIIAFRNEMGLISASKLRLKTKRVNFLLISSGNKNNYGFHGNCSPLKNALRPGLLIAYTHH
jgi:hypothetical protein